MIEEEAEQGALDRDDFAQPLIRLGPNPRQRQPLPGGQPVQFGLDARRFQHVVRDPLACLAPCGLAGLHHATATAIGLHQYARQQLQKGNKAEAIRVWQLNAKNHPNEWPVNVGLMRAYSAEGKYKEALKYAKMAMAQAPDDGNKKNLEASIKKLEEGKDVNL